MSVESISRVTTPSGSKCVASTPCVIRFAAAQPTASAYQASAGTSAKLLPTGLSIPPPMRERIVTTIARVMEPSGPNSVSVTPLTYT